MLIAIALFFSIAWLPLNVLNLVLDLYNPFSLPGDEEKMLIIYAVCHLFGMSSACANPFLYGWFNGNFRNEFIRILGAPLRFCLPSSGRAAAAANRSSITVHSHPEITRHNTLQVIEHCRQSTTTTTIDRVEGMNFAAVLDQQKQAEMSTKTKEKHSSSIVGQAGIGGIDVESSTNDDETKMTKSTSLSGSLALNKKTKPMETNL